MHTSLPDQSAKQIRRDPTWWTPSDSPPFCNFHGNLKTEKTNLKVSAGAVSLFQQFLEYICPGNHFKTWIMSETSWKTAWSDSCVFSTLWTESTGNIQTICWRSYTQEQNKHMVWKVGKKLRLKCAFFEALLGITEFQKP